MAAVLGALATGAAPLASSVARASIEDVRVFDANWIDDARGRLVPARLYWPHTSSFRGLMPLVVFSHGLGQSRESYRYLGGQWSGCGIASLHVQHVGSDASVWTGNPLTMIDRLQEAAHEREAIERARDVRFALDRILDPRINSLHALIDHRRIVAAGHSYGANTTLMVLGARVIREGRTVEYGDTRFKAGIVISAPPFYGEPDVKEVLKAIDAPTLHVTATEDVIELPGYYSPAQDRLDIYNAIINPQKMIAVFQGGSHSIFTDRPWTGGVTLNPKVKQATAEAGLAFIDLVFRSDTMPFVNWRAKWDPILAVAPTPFLIGTPSRGFPLKRQEPSLRSMRKFKAVKACDNNFTRKKVLNVLKQSGYVLYINCVHAVMPMHKTDNILPFPSLLM